jgi:hypothetical protein
LDRGFLEGLHASGAVEPREEEDFHRSAEGYDLASIFCLEAERRLSRDWIVRFENHFYQRRRQSKYQPAKGKVWVRKDLNSELHFNDRGADLAYEQLPERPVRSSQSLTPKKSKRNDKPSPDHPWRKSWKQK